MVQVPALGAAAVAVVMGTPRGAVGRPVRPVEDYKRTTVRFIPPGAIVIEVTPRARRELSAASDPAGLRAAGRRRRRSPGGRLVHPDGEPRRKPGAPAATASAIHCSASTTSRSTVRPASSDATSATSANVSASGAVIVTSPSCPPSPRMIAPAASAASSRAVHDTGPSAGIG